MCPARRTVMIGACPSDGLTPAGEELTVIHDMTHLYINGEMAAERRRRFHAEAQLERQLAHLDRIPGRGTARSGGLLALRNDAATWMDRWTWHALRQQRHVPVAGKP